VYVVVKIYCDIQFLLMVACRHALRIVWTYRTTDLRMKQFFTAI
jgi:hypothetical protein